MQTTKNAFVKVLIILGIIVIATIVSAFMRGFIKGVTGHASPSRNVSGFVLSREAYNANCTPSFNKAAGPGYEDKAETYCGCTYDLGVQKWGGEEFTKQIVATKDSLTPEMNEIINSCIEREGK